MSRVGVKPFNSLNELTTVPVCAARANMRCHGPVPPISSMVVQWAEAFVSRVAALGLEGVVAKRLDSS
jgi:hypothetical protein